MPLIKVGGGVEVIVCDHCGTRVEREYKRRAPLNVFCSRSCRSDFQTGENSPRFKADRTCERCGAHRGQGARFCSRACATQVQRGESAPNFIGRVRHSAGYVRIYKPEHPLANSGGYVMEHRLVVSDAGVEVPDGYHVHHLNHDKADNRLENLAVMSAQEHQAHHYESGAIITNQYGTFPLRRDR